MEANNRGKITLFRRVCFALTGIWTAFHQEANLRIQLIAILIVLGAAWWLQVSLTHFLILLVMIGSVIALELVNTAIERLVDLVTEDVHPLAKAAKDIAAGAVLFAAMIAAVIGGIVFITTIF